MQNLEEIPSRLWVRLWEFLKGHFSQMVGFQQSHHTQQGLSCAGCWALCSAVPGPSLASCCEDVPNERSKYTDKLQEMIEHVSKLPCQYDAILTSVIKLVLYMRHTNRSWPVKLSEVSRENQSMRLTLKRMCNLLHNDQCKLFFQAGLTP